MEGPEFLSKSSSAWSTDIQVRPIPEDDPECKTKDVLLVSQTSDPSLHFKFERYSSWTRLLRVFAWILNFINNTRKVKKRFGSGLSADELECSTKRIISMVLNTEFNSTQAQRCLPPLRPFTNHDGLVRVGGRLSKSSVPFEAKHQLLLPKNHHISQLLLSHYHKETAHSCYEQTIFLC